MRSFLQPFVRLLFPTGSVRRRFFNPIRGAKFIVAPGMGVSYALGRGGYHLADMERRLYRGDTVMDVGANRGQAMLLFGHIVGETGSVTSFEPVPNLADVAGRNAALNGLGHVTVFASAVSNA